MSEPTYYALPLAPQDLVSIYKEKQENDNYILFVDYVKTREKLNAEHTIIYLANTNFKASFTIVDEDLIKAYISSDFIVDCPLLARIVSNILRVRFEYPLNQLDEQLLPVFPMELIHEFIDNNYDFLEEVIDSFQSVIPFVLENVYKNMDQESKDLEVDLREFVENIEVVDKPTKCGPNIARLLTTSWDAFLLIMQERGLSQGYNKALYNDAPKYFGTDLFFVLNQSKITSQILAIFPPWFFRTIDIAPIKEDEEIDADNKE
jgi:hypothetical protein